MVAESGISPAKHRAVAETVRVEGARILATLIRTVGDVQIAEDAVQEATLAALSVWPISGVPPEPRAWLTVTARRKAIDILRREQARPGKERAGLRMIEHAASGAPSEHRPDPLEDDDVH
ncbi:MAG: sigma factor, partial [Nakamurella sp.]